MPTVFTHAAVAVAAGNVFPRRPLPFYFWVVSVYCSLLPDADVLAFGFWIPYEHMLGHRGLSHSFVGAAAIGALAACVRLIEPLRVTQAHQRAPIC